MLPSHRFASGAEEKIIRVFDCTKNFLQNLSRLSKVDVESDFSRKVGNCFQALTSIEFRSHDFYID